MSLVTIERIGAVARLTLNNPPVNALGHALRDALSTALDEIAADPSVEALVLAGAGRFFIAGADISEFGKPPKEPMLPGILVQLEAMEIPSVAAIHGAALGGGLETALACGHRIAAEGTKFALPETTLGILPGAGGTQRTPRLIGLEATLDLVTSGKRLDAAEALDLGLVDAVCPAEDLAERAIAMATDLIAAPRRRVGDLPPPTDTEAIAGYRARFSTDAPGQYAQAQAIEAVAFSADSHVDEGLAEERRRFLDCMDGPERAGLIHAFFAERRAAKVPEADAGTARPLEHGGIVGGGTMGAGIAAAMLLNGMAVTMVERDAEAAAAGHARVDGILDGSVKRGKLTDNGKAALMTDKFTVSSSYDALAAADVVVEAVFEDMDVKKAVFGELDRVCKPGAVLATNTSYLDINEIATATNRPESVIGLHFFSPAHVMKLLEIVIADKTDADTCATSFALAKMLRKVAVRAGVCDGFIGNRILMVYRAYADQMMLDGATPYEIDDAIRGFGFPMGPYQVADLAGLDIGWATRKRKAATRDPRERYVAILDRICERGWFGRKTGRGVYRYDQGDKDGTPDPEVLEILEAERTAASVDRRQIPVDEIQRRYMSAMINESAKVVGEGIALRPSDVDVTLLFGYGFPRYRGGPLKYADRVGLRGVLRDIETFAEEDPYFWQPAPLLRDLATRGETFDSLNTD